MVAVCIKYCICSALTIAAVAQFDEVKKKYIEEYQNVSLYSTPNACTFMYTEHVYTLLMLVYNTHLCIRNMFIHIVTYMYL